MSMGDKIGITRSEELPEKNASLKPGKQTEKQQEDKPARVVDDKLIGDDRDLQDALEKPESKERDPGCDNNY